MKLTKQSSLLDYFILSHPAVFGVLAALLITSCQMSNIGKQCLPCVRIQNATLAECVDQLQRLTKEVTPDDVPVIIAVDHSPATITWKNISYSNTNEAHRLEARYNQELQEWLKFSNTNRISFAVNWISVFDALKLVADMNGGYACSNNGKLVIRYGAPKLLLRQYSHKGWYDVVHELRIPLGTQYNSEFILATSDQMVLISYVSLTDDLLVLGSDEQQSAFRKLMEDFK
jgi:hypothetical protein